jgi:hypothetical protein
MPIAKDRLDFVKTMAKEGMDGDTARSILRLANIIQRCAMLECSSEAANADRVDCPNKDKAMTFCGACDAHANNSADIQHLSVTRISVKCSKAEDRIRALCKPLKGFEAIFSGDPRGACVKIRVPSGRSDSWGGEGMCVPAEETEE